MTRLRRERPTPFRADRNDDRRSYHPEFVTLS